MSQLITAAVDEIELSLPAVSVATNKELFQFFLKKGPALTSSNPLLTEVLDIGQGKLP